MFPQKDEKYEYEDPIAGQAPISSMPSDHELRMKRFVENRNLIEPLKPDKFNPYFTHEVKAQEKVSQHPDDNPNQSPIKNWDVYDYGLKTKKFKREKMRSKELPKVLTSIQQPNRIKATTVFVYM
jgi:hypothetical protein